MRPLSVTLLARHGLVLPTKHKCVLTTALDVLLLFHLLIRQLFVPFAFVRPGFRVSVIRCC